MNKGKGMLIVWIVEKTGSKEIHLPKKIKNMEMTPTELYFLAIRLSDLR
jgi:hypothetical protein